MKTYASDLAFLPAFLFLPAFAFLAAGFAAGAFEALDPPLFFIDLGCGIGFELSNFGAICKLRFLARTIQLFITTSCFVIVAYIWSNESFSCLSNVAKHIALRVGPQVCMMETCGLSQGAVMDSACFSVKSLWAFLALAWCWSLMHCCLGR